MTEPNGELAKVLTEQETIDDLLARSKDDHASRMIVGSEVRWLISRIDALRARAEQAEKDRDEARGYCDDLCWMMDRCHACGHRLRFEASGCPQCRAKAVAPWNEPKEMPDTCKCDRCALARAGEVKP